MLKKIDVFTFVFISILGLLIISEDSRAFDFEYRFYDSDHGWCQFVGYVDQNFVYFCDDMTTILIEDGPGQGGGDGGDDDCVFCN